MPKKQKHSHETLHFSFSNVTTFGRKVQDWLWHQGDTIMLFQETHLVHPARHLLHHVHTCTKQGNGWAALRMERQGGDLFLIQVYLKTGESFQSPLNAELLGQLLQFLGHLHSPFIIGGDWQNSPEELASTIIPSKFRAQTPAKDEATTLQGSHLDYILASTSIYSALQLHHNWEVPWKPHCALQLSFNCEWAALSVQQLHNFPPIARAAQLPRNWTTFEETNAPFKMLGELVTGLGSDLARWASRTEKYLTQLLHKPTSGRGSQIKLQQGPLLDATKPRIWKNGSPAFWEKMTVRLNILTHGHHSKVHQDLQAMISLIPQHASAELDQAGFQEQLQHWLAYPARDLMNLRQIIQQELHYAQQQLLSSTNHEFREWLEKAHDKGLRGLFRSLRQKDHAWQRPFQSLPPTQRLEAREEQWGQLWIVSEGPTNIRGLQELQRRAQAQAATFLPLDTVILQKLMRKLPNKAAGPDGISYDFLRHLPFPAVERLAQLLTEMERTAELPTQLRYTNIVLIPNNEKIERPIALTSCLYRLWNRYRKFELQHWQLGLDKDMPWDQARPHRDCLSIAVGRMMKAEIGKHQGIYTVSCLADLTCFYDTVTLDHLIEPALDLQYPPLHLKLALDLYTGPRLLQAEGISGAPKHYQKGILQGCPQTPAIAKLVLYKPLRALVQDHPAVQLQTWVDDVSFDIKGTDADYVAREAVLAFRSLKKHVEAAGLKINSDKTGFISSSREVAKALDLNLQATDPKHFNVLRDLGIDATNTRRRRVMQIKKRFLKGRGRAGIMHRLKLNPQVKYRLHRGAIHQ